MKNLSVFFDHVYTAARQSNKSVEEVLRFCKKWGIDLVEINCLDPEIKGAKELLCKCEIGVSCVCADLDFVNDDAEASAKKYGYAFDIAEKFNCNKVLCIPGFFKVDEATCSQFDGVCDRLNEMCCEAKKRGITVAVEDFDHSLSPCCNTAQLKELTDRIEGLGIAFDLGNFSYCKEDIAPAYELLKDKIVHLHLKDRGFKSTSDNYTHNIDGEKMYSLPVGEGDLNLGYWIKRIIADGYEGAMVIEHFSLNDQLSAIERSAQFVKSLF